MHRSITSGRRVAGLHLLSLEVSFGEIASAIQRADSRLSASEMRDRIREVQRTASDRIEAALSDVGDDIASQYIREAMAAHASEALDEVRGFLRAGQAAGVGPEEMRVDFARLINGESIDYGLYDLSSTQVNGIRTLSSDARRLLVSEANEAIRRVALDSMAGEGGKLAPWETSPNHKEQDICDDIAAGGPYRLNKWPRTPHAYCGCMPGDAL